MCLFISYLHIIYTTLMNIIQHIICLIFSFHTIVNLLTVYKWYTSDLGDTVIEK